MEPNPKNKSSPRQFSEAELDADLAKVEERERQIRHGRSGPTPDLLELFLRLIAEVQENQGEYLEAAAWFTNEFSLAAIDARAEASQMPLERMQREEAERRGAVLHKRSDTSGYMERLIRAVEELLRHDDSALPRVERTQHDRRVILVADLMADPDLIEHAPELSRALHLDRPHWPTAKALTDGGEEVLELDRWWAREYVFDPHIQSYRAFESRVRRALRRVPAVHTSQSPQPSSDAELSPGAHVQKAPPPSPPSLDHLPALNQFRMSGEVWEVTYGGKTVQVKKRKGMGYISALIAKQRMPISVIDLGVPTELRPSLLRRPQALVERPEVGRLLARQAELKADFAEARDANDLGREKALAEELEHLQESLDAVQGAQGRGRAFGDEPERVRKRVGNAIEEALRALELLHPELAKHLRESIIDPAGASPRYSPHVDVMWVLAD